MPDEHQAGALGCAGHPIVRPPTLDRMAAEGTRFDAAYTASPICVPARAAFATGRYTHETGYWCNAHPHDGRVKGWGHRLQEAGHAVLSIGKLHYRDEADPTGFDAQVAPMHVVDGIGDVMGAVRDQLPVRPRTKALSEKIGPGESGYTRYDRRITEETVRWLTEAGLRQERPWVLFVSLVCPHFPLIAPPEFYDLYPPDEMPAPRDQPEDGVARHPWIDAQAECQIYDRFFSEETRRIAIASYYGLCSFLDDNIAKILTALEGAGLAGSTRVIYTSDHGDNLGARGLWGKSNMYQESAAIPLIARGPGVPAGKIVKTPVSLIDAYPTILDCVGVAARAEDKALPGASLWDIAAAADDANRVAFSEYHAVGAPTGAFMIRKGRFKYIHYVDYPPQLFDLDADPMEREDLAGDAAHAAVLAALAAALRAICDPETVDRRAKADQAGPGRKARRAGRGGRPRQLQRDAGAGRKTGVWLIGQCARDGTVDDRDSSLHHCRDRRGLGGSSPAPLGHPLARRRSGR
jgi:choline-sulfatase